MTDRFIWQNRQEWTCEVPRDHDMNNSEFLKPAAQCDLIMQGGITSGVVYPGAVLKLATRYRFRSIGGTSAGAMAAAATAAAELGRDSGGFDRLSKLPEEFASCLSSLLQPRRPFRGVFAIFLACLGNRSRFLKIPRVLARVIVCFPLALLAGLSPTLFYLWRTWGSSRDGLEWAGIVAAGVAGIGLAWLGRLLWLVLYSLPRASFGVCPGLRQKSRGAPAVTEWLTDLFDRLAGIRTNDQSGPPLGPLTFGHLDDAEIELKMMTTDLSVRRPYTLPFVTHAGQPQRDGRYAFDDKEWQEYFPERVMRWLRAHTDEVRDNPGYRYLPDSKDLPVIVAVRMSLSFPLLLSAIPLYRQDWTCDGAERERLRRCIFSDGGISSNFPIHFFDTLLPIRPTFAIALESYSTLRCTGDTPQDRVSMPESAGQGSPLPIAPVRSLPNFLAAIIDSARNWQDNLQRILPGYRERIAHIALTDAEGGLNLTMDAALIKQLNTLGDIAGDHMLGFNLQEHQWRRFLVAYARLEETFEHMNAAYAGGFETFLNSYPPGTASYIATQPWFDEVHARLRGLVTLTAAWTKWPLRTTGDIPKPDTNLRITSKP
jgi:predicted acylesterase/phospholipase RssA